MAAQKSEPAVTGFFLATALWWVVYLLGDYAKLDRASFGDIGQIGAIFLAWWLGYRAQRGEANRAKAELGERDAKKEDEKQNAADGVMIAVYYELKGLSEILSGGFKLPELSAVAALRPHYANVENSIRKKIEEAAALYNRVRSAATNGGINSNAKAAMKEAALLIRAHIEKSGYQSLE